MIVFNEGLPGAGKSYDAVATHIVPAIKAGRRVFARLNGLDHAAIAAYVGKSQPEVRELLTLVEPDEVTALADRVVNDSLIVIDECHEFYVASRQPLPEGQERFFAMHRHAGLDIVLISQFYKRVHGAVRARIERKNLFRKLTAAGLNNRYVVSFMAATAPDKFEKVGAETRKYDPAIFALYQSVQGGTSNLETYEGGGKTLWSGKLKWGGLFLLFASVWGIWKITGFFSGDAQKAFTKHPAASKPVAMKPFQEPARARPSSVGMLPTGAKKPSPEDVRAKLSPESVYILDLNDQARARLAGWIQEEGKTRLGLVEWVASSGVVIERLSFAQLRALGWVVNIRDYGAILKREDQTVIVTGWPRDFAGQLTDQGRAKLADVAARSPSVSEPSAPPSPPASYEALPLPGRIPDTARHVPMNAGSAWPRSYQ